ncbi:MAG TPA: S1/P1 nuclease [Steroidobacteraceae bacterium]|nr:S1/P1 nuclease [Steroidobacteraceae bacterium]
MSDYPYFPRALGALGVLVLLAFAPAAPARAWGAEGHRIVGLVAERLLDARTRRALRAIAGDDGLADIGLWMDRERDRLRAEWPGSERWHYDNRPVCAPAAPAAQYCADGNCASRAFDRALARLDDHAAPRDERLEALRLVVHLVGDAHQPLHAADHDDRGGNDVAVSIGRRARPESLHAAWDREFVKRAVRGESEPAFAERLIDERRASLGRLEAGSFASWEQESYDLARSYAYGRLPGFRCGRELGGVADLPPAYADGAAEIVEERLARAGIRLAALLRATL